MMEEGKWVWFFGNEFVMYIDWFLIELDNKLYLLLEKEYCMILLLSLYNFY